MDGAALGAGGAGEAGAVHRVAFLADLLAAPRADPGPFLLGRPPTSLHAVRVAGMVTAVRPPPQEGAGDGGGTGSDGAARGWAGFVLDDETAVVEVHLPPGPAPTGRAGLLHPAVVAAAAVCPPRAGQLVEVVGRLEAGPGPNSRHILATGFSVHEAADFQSLRPLEILAFYRAHYFPHTRLPGVAARRQAPSPHRANGNGNGSGASIDTGVREEGHGADKAEAGPCFIGSQLVPSQMLGSQPNFSQLPQDSTAAATAAAGCASAANNHTAGSAGTQVWQSATQDDGFSQQDGFSQLLAAQPASHTPLVESLARFVADAAQGVTRQDLHAHFRDGDHRALDHALDTLLNSLAVYESGGRFHPM